MLNLNIGVFVLLVNPDRKRNLILCLCLLPKFSYLSCYWLIDPEVSGTDCFLF